MILCVVHSTQFQNKNIGSGLRTPHAIIISAFGNYVGERQTDLEGSNSRLFLNVGQLSGNCELKMNK